MDLTLAMRAFIRTVERGSVTAAARDLGISQPGVSKLLRNLEQEVQVRLLERNSRSLRPTPQGLRLYHDAAGALATLDAAMEAIRQEVASFEGTLRLHSPVCLGERQVQVIVAAFQNRHPNVSVHLTLENRMPDLIHEGVDLAFAVGQPTVEATICRRLGCVSRLLVASPSYVAQRGTLAEPEDLQAHAILATDRALERHEALALLCEGRIVEVPVRPVLITNNATVLRAAILAGRGVGTVQISMVAEELSDGRLLRVLPQYDLKASDLFLAYPSARPLRPLVREFIDFTLATFSRSEEQGQLSIAA